MTFSALLVGLILAFLFDPTSSLAGQDVDSTQAITWLGEFQEACRRVEPIWPESLCGPLMVVDPGTRTAFLSQPDPHDRFERRAGAYVGTLPDELEVANTAVDWEGTRWTMVMAPSMGADLFPRLRLMAHEAFHRIQPALGVTQASPMPGHLDDEWPRIWLRMELRALAAALPSAVTSAPATDRVQAQDDAGRQAAMDALHFRIQRIQHHPEADSLESLLEANEGVAEYTGFRFAMEATGEGVERVVNAMERFESTPTYVRALGYGTGPALGLLLDRFAEGWQGDVGSRQGGDSIPHMARKLAMVLDIPYPEAGSGSGGDTTVDSAGVEELRVRAAPYGFREVEREEQARAALRAARVAEYEQRLVEGPILIIEAPGMRGAFNPNQVFPMGALGSVHPTAMFLGDWGRIQVDEGGVLVSHDWSRIQVGSGGVEAPSDPGSTVQGPGWSLELNPEWSVVAGERDGDWRVVRIPRGPLSYSAPVPPHSAPDSLRYTARPHSNPNSSGHAYPPKACDPSTSWTRPPR
jgi:hypothetical protein